MRLVIAGCAAAAGLALGGCSSTGTLPGADLPLSAGNGAGSQYGNYAAQIEGEMRGPDGERCVIFNWDRPLTKDLVLRLRSASCDAPERPGWMVAREISRTVIPLSLSNLKDAPDAGVRGYLAGAGEPARAALTRAISSCTRKGLRRSCTSAGRPASPAPA